MTPITPQTREQMKDLWKKFVSAIRTVLPARGQRPDSYFQTVRDHALSLAEGEPMAEEIANGYSGALRSSRSQAAVIVGEEVRAFEQAVQEAKSGIESGKQEPLRKRLRDGAKTILGSVKEVFELSEYGKAILEVLKEAIELSGGD